MLPVQKGLAGTIVTISGQSYHWPYINCQPTTPCLCHGHCTPGWKCSTAVKCFPNRRTAGTDQDRGKGSDNLKAEITNGGVAAQFPVTAAALQCTGTKERVFFVVDTWHPFQLRDMATAYKSQTSRTALLFIMICLCNILLAIVYETRTSA